MIKFIQNMHPLIFVIIATMFEVTGDTIIRKAIYNHTGLLRIAFFLVGATLLFGYGWVLNLAPVSFGQIVGLYVATLFVVWQISNFFAFHTLPSVPIIVGGLFIIAGGIIITFWNPK